MSVRATNWAWETGKRLGLPPGQRLTLVRIADHADNDGVCWPGEKGLAEYSGADRRTIRRHLSAFEQAGLLHRKHRLAESGRGRLPDAICLHLQADDQADILSGRSPATNRTPVTGPTGHLTHDQPDISNTPYIEEPSGTVSEPPPLAPPGGNRSRDHDRHGLEFDQWIAGLSTSAEAAAAWAAAREQLADLAVWIDTAELAGDRDGQLYLIVSRTVHDWLERRWRSRLDEALATSPFTAVLISRDLQAAAA